jgi:hypothetical protein
MQSAQLGGKMQKVHRHMLFVRTVWTSASMRGNLQSSHVKEIRSEANHGEASRKGSHRPLFQISVPPMGGSLSLADLNLFGISGIRRNLRRGLVISAFTSLSRGVDEQSERAALESRPPFLAADRRRWVLAAIQSRDHGSENRRVLPILSPGCM